MIELDMEEVAMVSGAGWAKVVLTTAGDIFDALNGFADGVRDGFSGSGAHTI